MVQVSNLSSRVKDIINNYYNVIIANNHFADNIFKRLLVSLYSVRQDADSKVVSVLEKYRFELSEYFTDCEISDLQNEYKQVAMYCYQKGDIYYAKNTDGLTRSAYMSGNVDFTTPKSVVELCLRLADCQEGSRVYLPFAGLGSFALNQKVECKYDTAELCPSVWAYSKILLDSQNIHANVKCKDCLTKEKYFIVVKITKVYNYIFSFPPILSSRDNKRLVSTFIELADMSLSENGQMFCVLPSIFCSSKTGWYEFRKTVLGDMAPEYSVTVISLPNFFAPFTTVSMCVVQVKRDGNGDVCLVDASDDVFLTEKDVEDGKEKWLNVDSVIDAIQHSDIKFVWKGKSSDLVSSYSLLPSRYLVKNFIPVPQKETERLVELQDVIEFLPRVRKVLHQKNMPLVTAKDLSDDYLNCEISPKNTIKEEHPASIQPHSCLLMAYSWGKIKIGKLNVASEGSPVALGVNVIPFRIKEAGVTEEFVLRSLLSEIVAKQATMMSCGNVVTMLSKEDLGQIKIVLPSIEEQNEISKQDAITSKDVAELKLQQAFVDYKREIRTRKHALSQSVSAISSIWNTLICAIQRNGGTLNLSDSIGRVNSVSVSSLVDALTYGLKSLAVQTEYLADIDYDWRNLTKVEPGSFLKSYIDNHQIPDVEMSLSCPMAEDEKILMNIPKVLVERVLENIVTNAQAHGFVDGSCPKHQIRFVWSFDGDNVCISISNNGLPFKEGVDTGLVLTYGYSTSLHSGNHAGIGGADIKNIMEHLGSVDVLSNPTDEFPVTYVLKFNNVEVVEEGEKI